MPRRTRGAGAEEEATAEAPINPYLLDKDGKLSDGGKKQFELKGATPLVRVDLLAGGKFSHATGHVLVSGAGTRVEKGEWWPALNGNPLFDARNHPAVASRFEPGRQPPGGRRTAIIPELGRRYDTDEACNYPHGLKPGDKLDGREGRGFEVKEPTLLIGRLGMTRDHLGYQTPKGADSAGYVPISRSGTRAQKGPGSPVLNGNALFRTKGHASIVSPFVPTKAGRAGGRFRTSDR
jgi:hypothetical protein